MHMLKVFTIVVFFLISVFSINHVDAKSDKFITFIKNPPTEMIKGGSYAGNIVVTNKTNHGEKFFLIASDINPNDDQIEKEHYPVQSSLASWIFIQNEILNINAHASETVPFTITIPPNAEIGEKNAFFIVSMKQMILLNFKNKAVLFDVIPVRITIPGKVINSISFTHLPSVVFLDKKPKDMQIPLAMHNRGNISKTGAIKITWKNIFNNKKIGDQYISQTVFPQTNRMETISIPKDFPFGVYRMQINFLMQDRVHSYGKNLEESIIIVLY